MRVGIVAPMWGEAECFTPPDARRRRLAELGDGVLLCVSGMGSERAAIAARKLLEQGASALVSAGVAGGLDPRLSPGDLVIADRVIADSGNAVVGDPVLAADRRALPTDPAWRDALSRRLLEGELEFTIAPVLESIGVLTTAVQKASYFRETGAAAVDMESAAIALEAVRARVPCLVLRVVCDPAEMCIPHSALMATGPRGDPRPVRLMSALARHPGEIADLVRLRGAFRKAQTTLRTVVRLAGTRLCAAES